MRFVYAAFSSCSSRYIDTSAWSPKYYAPEFIRFANTTGRKKVMLGTDFPQLRLKDCVDKVNTHLVGVQSGLRNTSLRDFMGGNAIRVLKLPSMELEKHTSKL